MKFVLFYEHNLVLNLAFKMFAASGLLASIKKNRENTRINNRNKVINEKLQGGLASHDLHINSLSLCIEMKTRHCAVVLRCTFYCDVC